MTTSIVSSTESEMYTNESFERTAIIVDRANAMISYKRNRPVRHTHVDDRALFSELSVGRNVVHKCVCDSYIDTEDRNYSILMDLEKEGVRVKKLQIPYGHKQKGVDGMIVSSMVELASSNICDTIILVSGDLDMLYGVEEAHRNGKKVIAAAFKDNISMDLLAACDGFIALDKLRIIDVSRLHQRVFGELHNEPLQKTLMDYGMEIVEAI